jgi:hypothetical protein
METRSSSQPKFDASLARINGVFVKITFFFQARLKRSLICATTLSIMAFSTMTFSIMALTIMAFSITIKVTAC